MLVRRYMEPDCGSLPYAVRLVIPFPSTRAARIVYNSLRVDKDPKSSTASKSLTLENQQLCVHVKARSAKHLRVAVSSFFELLILSCNTMQRFSS